MFVYTIQRSMSSKGNIHTVKGQIGNSSGLAKRVAYLHTPGYSWISF